MTNHFKNTRIEFHILQSFPVTCLNRDDVGAPKSAMIGGVPRARVSSQCWKRQVRLQLAELGVTTGSRTKLISALVSDECKKFGATDEQAKKCGDWLEGAFIKQKETKKKTIKIPITMMRLEMSLESNKVTHQIPYYFLRLMKLKKLLRFLLIMDLMRF